MIAAIPRIAVSDDMWSFIGGIPIFDMPGCTFQIYQLFLKEVRSEDGKCARPARRGRNARTHPAAPGGGALTAANPSTNRQTSDF
jgi:hypothetical protein